MNYLRVLSMLSFVSFILFSCSSDKVEPESQGNKHAPQITSISPEKGEPETLITIKGENFGKDKSKVKVRFQMTDVTDLLSFNDKEIKVKAPAGFSDEEVKLSVLVTSMSSNIKSFVYIDHEEPLIKSTTATCFYNSTVVIQGEGFSKNKKANTVKFGDKEAEVIAADKTSLTVITPDLGGAANAEITVSKSGKTSNAKRITIEKDQDKIARYNWAETNVKPGVVYKTGQFSVFDGAERRIHILEVDLNEDNVLGIGVSSPHKNTVDICNNYNAVAGINAGYFPMGATTDKDPYIRIDGNTVQEGHLGVSQMFTNSALLINKGVASVRKFTNGGSNLNQVAAAIPVSEAENVIVSGPMLINSNVLEDVNMSNSHNSSSTGRTGIGVSEDGKRVFMVVVDYYNITGVSTLQLAKILQALGAVQAMNFDGGGSSTMFVKDNGVNGRVSQNAQSMRLVRSVVYVK